MTNEQKYNQVIKTIFDVCKIKGWAAHLISDDKNYQFATINISKSFDYESVEGVLDLILSKNVKYSIQKTSFYDYGLKTLLDAISLKLGELSWLVSKDDKEKKDEQPRPSQILIKILKNFDKSARQIKKRHNNRSSMEMNDEYDAQDLLHSVLRAFFDDVRPEEYTPSYAGSNSRVDFLLKKEKIVVEVKFASQKLKEKEIGNQLIIDIKKYQTHPDCEQLYCLIYDPNGEINNPMGLENDLSGRHNKIEVKVLVVPH